MMTLEQKLRSDYKLALAEVREAERKRLEAMIGSSVYLIVDWERSDVIDFEVKLIDGTPKTFPLMPVIVAKESRDNMLMPVYSDTYAQEYTVDGVSVNHAGDYVLTISPYASLYDNSQRLANPENVLVL